MKYFEEEVEVVPAARVRCACGTLVRRENERRGTCSLCHEKAIAKDFQRTKAQSPRVNPRCKGCDNRIVLNEIGVYSYCRRCRKAMRERVK